MYAIDGYELVKKLREYGFNFLTGEADALSMRILVDLNESAANILSEFMGGCEFKNPNYNSDSVKSCFLPRSSELFSSLLIFCIFRQSEDAVIFESTPKPEYVRNIQPCLHVFERKEYESMRDEIILNDEENVLSQIRKLYDYRLYQLENQPRRGMSNIHAFTGRSQ